MDGIADNAVDIRYKSYFIKNHAVLGHLRHVLLAEVLNVLLLKILHGSQGNTFGHVRLKWVYEPKRFLTPGA